MIPPPLWLCASVVASRCSIIVAILLLLAACQVQMVKYVDVPEYQLRQGIIPERYVDADGVLVIHRPRKLYEGAAETTPIPATGRIEREDGTVELRALTPEQVIGHILRAILDEDYEPLWDQMVSAHTKREYASAGQGYEEFAAFMEANRDPLYAMLNRMAVGVYNPEVLHEDAPYGGMRLRLHPHFAKDYKFDTIDMVFEDFGLKLLMIHPRIRQ